MLAPGLSGTAGSGPPDPAPPHSGSPRLRTADSRYSRLRVPGLYSTFHGDREVDVESVRLAVAEIRQGLGVLRGADEGWEPAVGLMPALGTGWLCQAGGPRGGHGRLVQGLSLPQDLPPEYLEAG